MFWGDLAGGVLLDARAPTGTERASCTRYVRLLAGVALVLRARVGQIPVVAHTRRGVRRRPKPNLLRPSLLTLPPLNLPTPLSLLAPQDLLAPLGILAPLSFVAPLSLFASLGAFALQSFHASLVVFGSAGVFLLTWRLLPNCFFLAASVVGLR